MGILAAAILGGDLAHAEDPPHGLSGTFGESVGSAQVQPSNGAMGYSLPFVLPAARGTSQPELSLQYSSAARSGEAGFGWSLGIPSIERAPLSGWPKYLDTGVPAEEDRYAFDGQPLTFICVVGGEPACPETEAVGPMPTWANGYRHYRRQVDGSFDRLFLSPDRLTWLVQERGGEILELGKALTREDLTLSPAYDVDAPTGRVFRWNLARQHDLHGDRNLVVYRWAAGAPARTFLRDIYYTPPAAAAAAEVDDFAYHVELSWENPSYSQKDRTHADKRRHYRRLRRVAVSSKTWSNAADRELVRAYVLEYFAERDVPGAAGQAPLWGTSSLKSVRMEGRCGTSEVNGHVPDPSGCNALPATTFEYQAAELTTGVAKRSPLTGASGMDGLPYVISSAVMDVNHDGLPDIVQAWPQNFTHGPTHVYYLECNSYGRTYIITDAPLGQAQLVCNEPPASDGTPGESTILRSARAQRAWMNGGSTPSGNLGFEHNCLDAGYSSIIGTPTYYQIRQTDPGSGSVPARNTALFTQFGAEAMGDWGDASLLWSIADWRGFQIEPSTREGYCNEPGPDCEPAPGSITDFCPEASTNPNQKMLRWRRSSDGGWAKYPPRPTTEKHYGLVDVDGDGYADVLTDAVTPAYNLGFEHTGIRFSRKISRLESMPGVYDGPALVPFAVSPPGASSIASKSHQYVAYADINGDGVVDLVTADDPLGDSDKIPQVRPGDGRGGFECNLADDITCQVAGNGSWLGSAFHLFSPDSGVPWRQPWPLQSYVPYLGIAGSYTHFFHDVTGDGLADLIAYQPRQDQFDPASVGRLKLWVNVDGRTFRCANSADCVVGTITGDDQPSSFGNGATYRVVFADMDANGTEDFVLLGEHGVWHFSFLAVAPVPAVGPRAPRPGLLTRIRNGVGAETEIVYQTSQELESEFTDTDPQSFRAPWINHMPQVIPVVTRIATRDSRLVNGGPAVEPFRIDRATHFEYRDPAYDPWERSFKGFGRVRAIGPSGDVKETWFWFGHCQAGPLIGSCIHGSDEDDEKAISGAKVRVDRFIPGGGERPEHWLSTTTYVHSNNSSFIEPLGTNPDRKVVLSQISQTDEYLYDTDEPVNPPSGIGVPTLPQPAPTQSGSAHLRTDTSYDAAGNTRVVMEYGRLTPNGAPSDSRIRTTAFPPTERCHADWACLSTGVEVMENPEAQDQAILRHLQFGFNTTGDMVDVWADLLYPHGSEPSLNRDLTPYGTAAPSTASTAAGPRHLASFVVDEYGNTVATHGESGTQACTDVRFEREFLQFPESTSQFVGAGCTGLELVTQYAFDRGLGLPSATFFPNRRMDITEYDEFGRLSAVYAPAPDGGPYATELAAQMVHHSETLTSWTETRRRVDTDAYLMSIEIFNGLGEHVLGFDNADTVADGAPWVLRNWTERDDDGRDIAQYRPWFFGGDPYVVAATAPALTTTGSRLASMRDDFGRPRWTYDGAIPTSQITHLPLEQRVRDAEQLKPSSPYAGNESRVVFDGHGRRSQMVVPAGDGSGTTTTITYLGTGEPLTIQREGGGQTYQRTMQWDTLGRMVRNAEPNVGVWRYVYDDDGHLVGTSDARGCGKNLHYDALGRVLAEDFSPCSPDQPYTPPNLGTGDGTEVFYSYDSYESGQVDPTSGFDDDPELALGRLVSIQDRGSHTRLNYDGRGRIRRATRRIVKPGAPENALADRYTSHWFKQEAQFDVGDRLRARSTGLVNADLMGVGGESLETMVYSSRGTIRAIGSSYGTIASDLAYSASGQLLSAKYGDVANTTRESMYDGRDMLRRSIVQRVVPPAIWTTPPNGGYSVPGVETTQLNLTYLELHYDDVGNPLAISDGSADYWPQGAKPVSRTFRYDAAYRIAQVDYSHQLDNHLPPFLFEADTANRQPVAEVPGQQRIQSERFEYDWQGNLTYSDDNESLRFDRSLGEVFNGKDMGGTPRGGPNQLIEADYTQAKYDAAGNMIELTVGRPTCWDRMPECSHRFIYDWDEVGQMVRARRWDFAAGGVPALDLNVAPMWDLAYAYSEGSRVLTSFSESQGTSSHTLDVFDTLRVARTPYRGEYFDYEISPETEVGLIGGGLARVFFDRAQVLPQSGNTPLHVYLNVGDHLGSSAFVIDKDSSELVERTSYQAFGATESDLRPERWGASRNEFKFTAKEEDVEVGITYFGARYYSARLGRWMSADPLTIHALGADPNPYAYVGGRVTSFVDPLGLDCVLGAGVNGSTEWTLSGPCGGDTRDAAVNRGPTTDLRGASQFQNAAAVQRWLQQVPGIFTGTLRKKEIKGARRRPPWSWGAFARGVWNGMPAAYAGPMAQIVGMLAVPPVDNPGYDWGVITPAAVGTLVLPVVGAARSALARRALLAAEEVAEAGSVGAMRRYMFEASPKHPPGISTRPGVSPGPTNGQGALDNSTSIGNGPRRIGLDPATGEFVVFAETQPGQGIFHGWTQAWKELPQKMRNELIRGGFVNRRGSILP